MVTVYYFRPITRLISKLISKYCTSSFNIYGLDEYFKTHLPECYNRNNEMKLDVKQTTKLLRVLNISLNDCEIKHCLYYRIFETNKDVQLHITVREDGVVFYGISVTEGKGNAFPEPTYKYTVKIIK